MSDAVTDAEWDEANRDLVFVLMPAEDIHRRVDPAEFIAFVAEVVRTVSEFLHARPSERLVEVGVNCAILPGGRTLVEVVSRPEDPATEQLAEEIRTLPAPTVDEGPVAFLRRVAVGPGPMPPGGMGTPFESHVRRHGPGLIDDILMRAGGVPGRGWVGGLVHKLFGERKPPPRSIWPASIIPRLAETIGCPVITTQGRIRFD